MARPQRFCIFYRALALAPPPPGSPGRGRQKGALCAKRPGGGDGGAANEAPKVGHRCHPTPDHLRWQRAPFCPPPSGKGEAELVPCGANHVIGILFLTFYRNRLIVKNRASSQDVLNVLRRCAPPMCSADVLRRCAPPMFCANVPRTARGPAARTVAWSMHPIGIRGQRPAASFNAERYGFPEHRQNLPTKSSRF
jgi:hypothetical protein